MKTPQLSQSLDFFLEFWAQIMQLQRVFYSLYHAYCYIRYPILTAVYNNSIQTVLRNRVARTPEHGINRLMNRQSEQFGSNGSAVAHFTDDVSLTPVMTDNRSDVYGEREVSYTLEQSNKEEAKRAVMAPWARVANRAYIHRQFSSSWVRGVSGCFVCGRDHRAWARQES